MEDEIIACPLCGFKPNRWTGDSDYVWDYECLTCGDFRVRSYAEDLVMRNGDDSVKRSLFKLSAFTRAQTLRRQATESDESLPVLVHARVDDPYKGPGIITIDEALALFPQTVADRLDRTLINLKWMSAKPGAEVRFDKSRAYPVGYAEDMLAFNYIMDQLEDAGYAVVIGIRLNDEDDEANSRRHIQVSGIVLTAAGWNRIAEIESGLGGAKPDQGFVAMWFKPELRPIYENGFERGINDAGYKSLRVDYAESNDLLDDQIIAGIRESRFLVADLTGHRHNAYFEAGFAMGLGLKVIWTCHRDELGDVKFDASHYPIIDWTTADELRERLAIRIRATIGVGPA